MVQYMMYHEWLTTDGQTMIPVITDILRTGCRHNIGVLCTITLGRLDDLKKDTRKKQIPEKVSQGIVVDPPGELMPYHSWLVHDGKVIIDDVVKVLETIAEFRIEIMFGKINHLMGKEEHYEYIGAEGW